MEKTVHVEMTERGQKYIYDIPEAWLVGYTANGKSVNQAVVCWHTQAKLAERFKKEAKS